MSGVHSEGTMTGEPILTEEQGKALADVLAWAKGESSDWAMSLTGHAGTGKTTLVQQIAKSLTSRNASVCLTAPTNKAVKVLRSMAAQSGLGHVPAMTIHKLLSLKMSDDSEQRELIKKNKTFESMEGYGVVVVDEASMIGEELFRKIEEEALRFETKVLFVGDPLQLPPVKSAKAATDLLSPFPASHLEKVVRQAEANPIIGLASWMRAQLTAAEWTSQIALAEPGEDGIHIVPCDRFHRAAAEALAGAVASGRDVKAIAWRNATVNRINAEVRQMVYGEAPEQYIVGERIVVTSTAGAPGLHTDCEARVTGLYATTHRDMPGWECIYVQLETEDGTAAEVPVIHPLAKGRLEADLQKMAAEARSGKRWMWPEFWALKGSFAEIRPCYAITAHRSQGSTYDTVWVDANDILSNPNRSEAIKCLYVAITRASHNVFVSDFSL